MNLFRIPIKGWRRCVHEAVAFDSPGEYAAAVLLDEASSVNWWLRNEPALLKIPSPAGNLEPDFVYSINRAEGAVIGVLEIKSNTFWDGPGSDARVKGDSACEWVRAINATSPPSSWEFAVVLDQDAERAESFEAMRNSAVLKFPE